MTHAYPNADYLRSILSYEPETGLFRWLVRKANRIRIGDVAGSADSKGYIHISIDNLEYPAHRLAYLMMTGQLPPVFLDHEDLNPSNNRWLNIRPATRSQNGANSGAHAHNTSGYKGVSFNKQRGRWEANIRINGKRLYLGLFDDPAVAHAAYVAAAAKHHGDFTRTG